MSKIIERLKSKAAAIGATVDEYDSFLCIDAPPGYTWRSNGCRSITVQFANNGGQTWLAKAMVEAEKCELSMGLSKVTNADELAVHQHEMGDDAWMADNDAPEQLEWPK